MLGKDLKNLIRTYSDYISNGGVEEFLSIDEEILEQLVVSDNVNFREEAKSDVLLEIAKSYYPKEKVLCVLKRLKTASADVCSFVYDIIDYLMEYSTETLEKCIEGIVGYEYDIDDLRIISEYISSDVNEEDKCDLSFYELQDSDVIKRITSIKSLLADKEVHDAFRIDELLSIVKLKYSIYVNDKEKQEKCKKVLEVIEKNVPKFGLTELDEESDEKVITKVSHTLKSITESLNAEMLAGYFGLLDKLYFEDYDNAEALIDVLKRKILKCSNDYDNHELGKRIYRINKIFDKLDLIINCDKDKFFIEKLLELDSNTLNNVVSFVTEVDCETDNAYDLLPLFYDKELIKNYGMIKSLLSKDRRVRKLSLETLRDTLADYIVDSIERRNIEGCLSKIPDDIDVVPVTLLFKKAPK